MMYNDAHDYDHDNDDGDDYSDDHRHNCPLAHQHPDDDYKDDGDE